MLFRVIKRIRIVKEPKYSIYPWGNLSELSGRELQVIEENKYGACLCISDQGLIDVDKRDIEGA